jgi:hypothetical protein
MRAAPQHNIRATLANVLRAGIIHAALNRLAILTFFNGAPRLFRNWQTTLRSFFGGIAQQQNI